jgi:WD40 repeat protein
MLGNELSSDGRYLVTVTEALWNEDRKKDDNADQSFALWDLKNSRVVFTKTIKGLKDAVLVSDAGHVATLTTNGVFRVWDPTRSVELPYTTNLNNIADLAPSEDRKYLALQRNETAGSTVQVLEALSGHNIGQLKTTANVTALAVSPDGSHAALVTGEANSVVSIFETKSGREVAQIKTDNNVEYLEFSKSGQYLTAMMRRDRSVRVWTLEGKQVLDTIGDGSLVELSADEKFAIAATRDDQIMLWSLPGGKVISSFENKNNRSLFLRSAFTSDSRFVVVQTDEGLQVIETATGCEVARIRAGRYDLLSFSNDSRYILTLTDGSYSKMLWRKDDLRNFACDRLTRNLTSEEWHDQYMIEADLPQICTTLPANPDKGADSKAKSCPIPR